MTDQNYGNGENYHGTGGTAERLIAQRIAAMRAAGYGSRRGTAPMPVGDASSTGGVHVIEEVAVEGDLGRWSPAGTQPFDAPAETLPLGPGAGDMQRVTVQPNMPTQAGNSSLLPSNPPADAGQVVMRAMVSEPATPSPELMNALTRVEHAVQDDVARVEQLLRSWGNPTTATNLASEQVIAAVEHTEQTLRREVTRIVEAVRATDPVDDGTPTPVEAVAAWSMHLEQQLGARVEGLRKLVAAVNARVQAMPDEIGRTANASAAIAGAGIGDKVVGAIDGLLEELSGDLCSRVDAVRASLERIEAAPGLASAGTQDEVVSAVMAAQFEELFEETKAGSQAVLDEVLSIAHRLEGEGPGAAAMETVRVVREVLETHHAHARRELAVDLQLMQETLVAAQEDVPDDLVERFSGALAGLQSRLDEQAATSARIVNEAIGGIAAAIDELRAAQQRDAAATRESMGQSVATLRERIIQEMDYNRLQQAQDSEALTSTLERIVGRLVAADQRIAMLEAAKPKPRAKAAPKSSSAAGTRAKK